MNKIPVLFVAILCSASCFAQTTTTNNAETTVQPTTSSTTSPSLIVQVQTLADLSINGFPLWAIIAIVAGACGIIIFILLILLCYACCCRSKNPTFVSIFFTFFYKTATQLCFSYRKIQKDRWREYPPRESVCQTDFVVESINVSACETGTMTKRNLYKQSAHEPIKLPVQRRRSPSPDSQPVFEIRIGGRGSRRNAPAVMRKERNRSVRF